MKNKKLMGLLAAVTLLSCGCSFNANFSKNSNDNVKSEQISNTKFGGLSQKEYMKLASMEYKSGENAAIFVNANNSTLNKSWKKNRIYYQNLDRFNRTSSSVTAFLDQNNIVKHSNRTRQIWRPTGWHSNRPGAEIYNRGHLIAYSLSGGINKFGIYTGRNNGDLNNPKNLFTQTAFANQRVQTYYEGQVREALRSGQKVIYQATPIFRGNEKMARGVNLQVTSIDGMLNYNVYIYNVQPGYRFDYSTGRAIKDNSMQVVFKQ